jgi:predicted O-linked N-acetylglucosamine transferase (SPINDLY family)
MKKSKRPSPQQLNHSLQTALQLHQSGQLEQAEKHYRQILLHSPKQTDALHYLGMLRHQLSDNSEALLFMNKAAKTDKKNPTLMYNLGVVYQAEKTFPKAINCYQQAITYNPGYAMNYNNLGVCYEKLGDLQKAQQYYQQALEHDPNCPAALNNLATSLKSKGQLSQAEQYYLKAIQLQPGFADAMNNLATVYQRQGKASLAHQFYQQALTANPNLNSAKCGFLLNLNYQKNLSANDIFNWHTSIANTFSGSDTTAHRTPVSDRKIRIGYVSPDFRMHSVAYFILPILQQHDKQRFDIYAYTNSPSKDAMTTELRSHCDHWREIFHLDDKQAYELIENDQIDILVDLTGHMANNRIGLFALKPAPIQISYLGYPNTSGLASMDYHIIDEHTDPADNEAYYSETLLRPSSCFLCFSPPRQQTHSSPPPVLNNGFITFGSFNNTAKINSEMLAIWAELLNRVPGSHLMLKSSAFHDATTKSTFMGAFLQQGISAERLHFIGHVSSSTEHLNTYQHVDIALDTFPYNGTTTTCEALWMGVPVISLKGECHASRVGYSLLNQLDLNDFVGNDKDKYIQSAYDLATNLSYLNKLRSTLRERMQLSGLMNSYEFTRNLEKCYEEVLLENN